MKERIELIVVIWRKGFLGRGMWSLMVTSETMLLTQYIWKLRAQAGYSYGLIKRLVKHIFFLVLLYVMDSFFIDWPLSMHVFGSYILVLEFYGKKKGICLHIIRKISFCLFCSDGIIIYFWTNYCNWDKCFVQVVLCLFHLLYWNARMRKQICVLFCGGGERAASILLRKIREPRKGLMDFG